MAKIGTKKREQWQGARFCEEAGKGQSQECDGKCHDATHRVERAKREECLGIPHTDARDLAKTTPEGLSQHESKINNDGKTRVVKRCVQTEVEPNTRQRRHGTCAGKPIGKTSLTGINRRAGKDANPKRDIKHRVPPRAASQKQNHHKGACPLCGGFGGGYLAPCMTSSRVTFTACWVGTQSTFRNSAATVIGI